MEQLQECFLSGFFQTTWRVSFWSQCKMQQHLSNAGALTNCADWTGVNAAVKAFMAKLSALLVAPSVKYRPISDCSDPPWSIFSDPGFIRQHAELPCFGINHFTVFRVDNGHLFPRPNWPQFWMMRSLRPPSQWTLNPTLRASGIVEWSSQVLKFVISKKCWAKLRMLCVVSGIFQC